MRPANDAKCEDAAKEAVRAFLTEHKPSFGKLRKTMGDAGRTIQAASGDKLGVVTYTVGPADARINQGWSFPRIIAARRGCRFLEITTTIEELPAVLAWVAVWAGMVDAPLVAPPVPFCEIPGPGPRWAQVLEADCEKQYFWTVAANDLSVKLTGKGMTPRDHVGASEAVSFPMAADPYRSA